MNTGNFLQCLLASNLFRYLICLILISSMPTHASGIQAEQNTFQDIHKLQSHVSEYTRNYLSKKYDKHTMAENVKISVSSLDSRLQLAKCDNFLTYSMKAPRHNARNVTVKTNCRINGKRLWSIFVPVSISIYSQVVVLKDNLPRGHILSSSDMSYQRVNTAGLTSNHITNIDNVVGKQVKRSLKAGAALRSTYVSEADVVKRGDAVALMARSLFLSVDTRATALSNGYIGETIRVRNSQSNRIIDAEVTGPGRVEIVSR